MVLREELEQREYEMLSPFAAKAKESKGRAIKEEEDPIRTIFQRDRDRIIHSKAFRRLMHKTQVFMAPEGDHFRTRLTHTIEVAQISRTIARALKLNEDLTEAIALGHDLGHTPFGHAGERYLNEIHPGGFNHNEQSLRVVDVLEISSKGRTLNLSEEVRDGILNHSGDTIPKTLEGKIVRLSDRIAYINHDIDDAMRAGIICEDDIPKDICDILGEKHGDRINALILDVVRNSDGKNDILQSEDFAFSMNKLRDFMFDKVYNNPRVKNDEESGRIGHVIYFLYDYFMKHADELPDEHRSLIERDGLNEVVKDYIACMTDRYAINIFNQLFVPESWSGVK